MGYFDKLKSFAKTVVKSGEAVGTQVYRKSKKPFRQYMAPERAEKALEKQLKSPQRAPMNVPKINFPKGEVFLVLVFFRHAILPRRKASSVHRQCVRIAAKWVPGRSPVLMENAIKMIADQKTTSIILLCP